ncbi:Uncharacterized conserved protein UCP028846 [Candidatus Koribacter versatilis Ellin345]|uniref:Uncharacterized conserved protein UCP028846 n=1 Tax=Koribacter versatilis (strain Ellin345) TaxID=204669 RepID=Q1IKC5_KORVE|nr:glycoside hydrolase family 125 protein [Candidatus Koribacter versatilis]ABF42675.1 Uncharacterized conserved protein UCP028846 [Candidatus Koribacter versatilis Ellin345]
MNITRRDVAKLGAAALINACAERSSIAQQAPSFDPAKGRPAPNQRKFQSAAVEDVIAKTKAKLGDTRLARLFENCFPNTLDTTVRTGSLYGKPDTFVITGDIPAMWLRDSSAQIFPYLPLAKRDPDLQRLLAGVIHRQVRCINIDPYANAFNFDREGSEFDHDLTQMRPELHERKWEIDSLCYPVRLAYHYWKTTADSSVFDEPWHEAARKIAKTFREQQRKTSLGPYSFRRETTTPNDTLNLDGYGNPVRPVGLIASGFRPSDDSCIFPFLIPSNLFAVLSLTQLSEILTQIYKDEPLSRDCNALAQEVREAINKYGKTQHLKYGEIYAYEVDGYGGQLLMDDANVPSLLSLPYLGICEPSDAIYQNTRRFVLSEDNPYFFKGKAAEGIGGPHVGLNMIWPLSLIIRGLTSTDHVEIDNCQKTLVATDAGTGFMHESFDKDDPSKFTRAWFAWANTLFGEFVLKTLALK